MRRGPPRGREPPGRAGGSNKTDARTCSNAAFLRGISRANFGGSGRENRYFEFAFSTTNRHGPALNCPVGSRPSARAYGLTWCGPILPDLGRPN